MNAIRLVAPVVLILAVIIGVGISTMAQMSENVLRSAHDAEWTGLDPHVASTVSSFHSIGKCR